MAGVCVNGKIKFRVHKYIIANIHTQATKKKKRKKDITKYTVFKVLIYLKKHFQTFREAICMVIS